jgi:putative FmdB family regulatory protein
MPIYEYRCKQCEGEFEKYVPGAATTVACPSCASEQVMRKLSVFGLRTAGAVQTSAPMSGGGACCGGGCSCH